MRLSKNQFTKEKHHFSEHEFKFKACKYGHQMSMLNQKECREGVTVHVNWKKNEMWMI